MESAVVETGKKGGRNRRIKVDYKHARRRSNGRAPAIWEDFSSRQRRPPLPPVVAARRGAAPAGCCRVPSRVVPGYELTQGGLVLRLERKEVDDRLIEVAHVSESLHAHVA